MTSNLETPLTVTAEVCARCGAAWAVTLPGYAVGEPGRGRKLVTIPVEESHRLLAKPCCRGRSSTAEISQQNGERPQGEAECEQVSIGPLDSPGDEQENHDPRD